MLNVRRSGPTRPSAAKHDSIEAAVRSGRRRARRGPGHLPSWPASAHAPGREAPPVPEWQQPGRRGTLFAVRSDGPLGNCARRNPSSHHRRTLRGGMLGTGFVGPALVERRSPVAGPALQLQFGGTSYLTALFGAKADRRRRRLTAPAVLSSSTRHAVLTLGRPLIRDARAGSSLDDWLLRPARLSTTGKPVRPALRRQGRAT